MDVSGQNLSTKKYFLAIVLPEPGYNLIEQIKEELYAEYGLKGGLRSPPHITLHRPFEWKVKKEETLIETLGRFIPPAPFEIQISDFDFFEPRVVFASVKSAPQLNAFHKALTAFCAANLRLLNEAEDLRGFHPHVTLAFRDLKKPLFYELREKFSHRNINFSFTCDSFQLLRFEKKWEILKNFQLPAGETV